MFKTCMTILLASTVLSACSKTSPIPPSVASAEVGKPVTVTRVPDVSTTEEYDVLPEVVIIGKRLPKYGPVSPMPQQVAQLHD
jgi:ABC-type glycerol-3-phosphate transport system substrate-binding protein